MASLLQNPQFSRQRIRLDTIIWRLITVLATFYAGILVGIQSSSHTNDIASSHEFEQAVRSKVEAILQKRQRLDQQDSNFIRADQARFGEATAHYAVGSSRVDKQDFVEMFDSGVPIWHQGNPDPAASEVLILYNGRTALPNIKRDQCMSASEVPPKLTAMDATLNCQTLHAVSTKSALRQCIAIVPQYESMHVQRWMRIKDSAFERNESPLVPVGRGQLMKGVDQFEVPSQQATRFNFQHLQTYLENVSSTQTKLKPILKSVAVDNTLVVMVCNRGQADLLANFICSSKARGLSLKNLVVFCTDRDTFAIASGLGVTAYHDEEIFGEIATTEAKEYGDTVFQEMMYAKVVAVQLANGLGYNVLFQDVDIVWHRNPLEYLQTAFPEFDLLFQEDGARSARYAPYSANSGFYFVRKNEKTRHLLTRMLFKFDTIMTTGSHQQALGLLLAEHSSLYNLRVKVLSGHEFAGGYQFHRDVQYMRDLLVARTREEPWIFHMSWTKNKDDKIRFFQQLGLWYLKENLLLGADSCSKEALVQCHFKDKPSVRPCRESPTMDRMGKSFWT
jgi:hypothetical protein